ncbi:MAG: hypothetical protein CMJ52_00600 [Planctomycetaceae bacterium]|nr:hypothetical protein [Planctomycetaceae bacterium]
MHALAEQGADHRIVQVLRGSGGRGHARPAGRRDAAGSAREPSGGAARGDAEEFDHDARLVGGRGQLHQRDLGRPGRDAAGRSPRTDRRRHPGHPGHRLGPGNAPHDLPPGRGRGSVVLRRTDRRLQHDHRLLRSRRRGRRGVRSTRSRLQRLRRDPPRVRRGHRAPRRDPLADPRGAGRRELSGGRLLNRTTRIRRSRRRGFNLVEVLIALAITATLLTATLAALDASFRAYQATTEEVSTQSIGRIVMHRMLTLIRTGTDFGPYPADPRVDTIQSDFIEFRTQNDEIVTITWNRNDRTLLYTVEGGLPVELLDGVVGTTDEAGLVQPPFTLNYEQGRRLYRATIDITVEPDDMIDLDIEGDRARPVRLVGSAMPRLEAV